MKIAIVDDSTLESTRLKNSVDLFCTQYRTQAQILCFKNGSDFLEAFNPRIFDIVFLDIYMEGMDGMSIAERIRELDSACLLIFCTTSAMHAVKSYRVRAFDYLVKPYTDAQLHETLRLAFASLQNRSAYIEVKEGWGMVKILLRDIIYTDYFNHYIQIHTRGRVVKSHLSFAEFSPMLLKYPRFLCCYRNCIINMDAVSALDEKDFIMQNSERVPIARAQRAALRQQYADYTFRKLDGGIGL